MVVHEALINNGWDVPSLSGLPLLLAPMMASTRSIQIEIIEHPKIIGTIK